MPWVNIAMVAGHSLEKKKRLHRDVTAAIATALEIPTDWVRIQLVEMTGENHSIGGVPLDEMKR